MRQARTPVCGSIATGTEIISHLQEYYNAGQAEQQELGELTSLVISFVNMNSVEYDIQRVGVRSASFFPLTIMFRSNGVAARPELLEAMVCQVSGSDMPRCLEIPFRKR